MFHRRPQTSPSASRCQPRSNAYAHKHWHVESAQHTETNRCTDAECQHDTSWDTRKDSSSISGCRDSRDHCCKQQRTCASGSNPSVDFRRCRESFETAIKQCPDSKFPQMAAATSFVLNSLQPMQSSEISAAIEVYVGGTLNDRHWQARDGPKPWQGWLELCQTFLTTDPAGYVHFNALRMSCFLRNSRISGIDASHRTIATACLIQVELDNGTYSLLDETSTCSGKDHPITAFSSYAAKHWKEHCRIARRSSLTLGAWPLMGGVGKDCKESDLDGSELRVQVCGFSSLSVAENSDGWSEVERLK